MRRLIALMLILLLGISPTAVAEGPAGPTPAPVAEAADMDGDADGMETGQEEKTVIRAAGSAQVTLPADIAVLTLDVRASGATVADAQQAAKEQAAMLHETLTGMGVEEADIQTTYFSVQTVYTYQYSKIGEQQEKPSGYSATANLVARVREMDRVGEVIDAAISGGAQSGYKLTFESTAYETAYATALTGAVEDAVKKADLLAQAAGLQLGKLRSVTELEGGVDGRALGDAGGDAVLHGTLSITANVEVCYGVK